MRQEKKRFDVETLYVLGAGASYALSQYKPRKDKKFCPKTTPVDAKFLAALYEKNMSKAWTLDSLEHIKENWLDPNVSLEALGLEEAIIKRVSEYDFLANIHSNRLRGAKSNAVYLNHLSHLITHYLSGCKPNGTGRLAKFVDYAFPPSGTVESYKNRIITFNYDSLIDNLLLDRFSQRTVYFDGLAKTSLESLRRKSDQRFSNPFVLKLHGSVNWRCDKEYFEQIINGTVSQEAKVRIWLERKSIPQPSDSVSPLIIPPIPNKPITRAGIFKHLWTRAYEYLHQARRIVIVGYSCPPTDAVARTMFSNFYNKNLEEVIVVDPNALSLQSYKEMIRTHSDASVRWGYFSNFEHYIDHATNM